MTLYVRNPKNKAIMTRSKLRNKFLKDRTESNKKAYCKQRYICVNILRKTKKKYYLNLDVRKVANNKNIWKAMKNVFSDKSNNFETITVVENI